MCMPSAPSAPPPVPMPTRVDAETIADKARQRLSVRQGYASQIKTGAEGAAGFGGGGQVPGLSSGTGQKMGATQ